MKTTTTQTVLVTVIKERDHKHLGREVVGRVEEGAQAEIVPRKSIRLFGTKRVSSTESRAYDRTFKIGDLAEYDSYNLSYYGEIVSITATTVSIRPRHSSCDSVKRLPLYTFNWRNRDFDDAEAFAKNADTMLYI